MIRLTRGIDLYIDWAGGRLRAGRPAGLSLTYLPVRLWITLLGECDRGSGMLMNVTAISRIVRQIIAEKEVNAINPWKILTDFLPEMQRAGS